MELRADSGVRGAVYDLDTGKRVYRVIALDVERGLLKAYNTMGDVYVARGRFKFVPYSAPKLGAPKCAKCPSVLTLHGDELCPQCNAKDRGYSNKLVLPPGTGFPRGKKCSKCSREATVSVADEVQVSPQVKGRVAYERGSTAGRRYYCEWCCKPPRILDSKGEVIREDGDS